MQQVVWALLDQVFHQIQISMDGNRPEEAKQQIISLREILSRQVKLEERMCSLKELVAKTNVVRSE